MLNKLTTLKKHTNEEGFTLLELMVVIIIIGILAAIAIPIFANQQKAAIDADSKSSIRQLRMAIELARVKTGLPLISITLQSCTACRFTQDPLSLPQTDAGWVTYYRTLDRISNASGMDVRNLLDGYGRPIFIDENETEGGSCSKDALGSYVNPYDPSRSRENVVTIPQYTTACRS